MLSHKKFQINQTFSRVSHEISPVVVRRILGYNLGNISKKDLSTRLKTPKKKGKWRKYKGE